MSRDQSVERELHAQCEIQCDRPYRHIEAVLTVDRQVVILGHPDQLKQLPEQDEDYGHNCDAMGCGQCHVLFRILLPKPGVAQPREGLDPSTHSTIELLDRGVP